jgi:hypothetical protein
MQPPAIEQQLSDRILSTRGLNTLIFSDPYAKLCFAASLVSQFERVTYIDLDTTFTAYFKAGLVRANIIDIYLLSEGSLVQLVKDVLGSIGTSSLVVFDSVNSFYSLFRAPGQTRGLNHLLSVLLMLLVRRGIDEHVPVLATSMLRYRKDGGWVQSPASKRLLQHKSAVRLSVDRIGSDLAVTIVGHDSIPAGTQVVYKNSVVTV